MPHKPQLSSDCDVQNDNAFFFFDSDFHKPVRQVFQGTLLRNICRPDSAVGVGKAVFPGSKLQEVRGKEMPRTVRVQG